MFLYRSIQLYMGTAIGHFKLIGFHDMDSNDVKHNVMLIFLVSLVVQTV